MLIQVHTDNNIDGGDALARRIEESLGNALRLFGERITRVEVHLSDEDGKTRGGADQMRCLLDARLAGLQPIAVSHRATTVDQALDGATRKLKHSIDSVLGRLDTR